MTAFTPRDHRGTLLDRDAGESAGSTRDRQFTLLQMMKAVLIVAVILAIAVQRPGRFSVPFLLVFLLILAAYIYALSRLPFRVRLTIELTTACFLLILPAWVWRHPFYIVQAEQTEELARLCSMMADEAGDERSRELFRREAARYSHRAAVLQIQALWYGLIRSATKEDPLPINERELILELGLLEAREWYGRLAKEMGIRRGP